jgi:hypothetical protein
VYNLKEAMLAKCYIEVLGLDKHSEAAQRLIKWKQPVDGQVRRVNGILSDERPTVIPAILPESAITR